MIRSCTAYNGVHVVHGPPAGQAQREAGYPPQKSAPDFPADAQAAPGSGERGQHAAGQLVHSVACHAN